jgi:signal transduction histidine kinase
MKPTSSKPKFLLVDDIEENLIALEALLERDDLEILKARSARAALELLLVHDIALALIDVHMPDMDGFELAELMRGTERTRHVPIIFLTASTSEAQRMFQGYDAGAVDFLFKPIEPRILRHKANVFFDLAMKRAQLEETLRMNELFVAAVSHDLRNPLSAIGMGVEYLALPGTADRAQQTLVRLKSSVRRMGAIIDELHDLARARLGGGIPLERASADISEALSRALAEQQAINDRRQFLVEKQGDLSGRFDSKQLERVFSNLIGNASRYGDPSSPVRVVLDGNGSDIEVSVHNAGSIPKELLPVLFDPFRSRLERRRPAEGLGLGLYIVRQIVVAHGGDVEVISNESEGTTFRFSLPRKEPVPVVTP